jgi:hypothetical protein
MSSHIYLKHFSVWWIFIKLQEKYFWLYAAWNQELLLFTAAHCMKTALMKHIYNNGCVLKGQCKGFGADASFYWAHNNAFIIQTCGRIPVKSGPTRGTDMLDCPFKGKSVACWQRKLSKASKFWDSYKSVFSPSCSSPPADWELAAGLTLWPTYN